MRAALPLLLLAAGCDVSTAPDAGQPAPQTAMHGMAGMAMGDPLPADATPAMRAFADANARMHAGMAVIDRDTDVAFMQGMLAHHKGAVEMAEVELAHGKDGEARRLARDIIAAQAREIAQMERWLAAHGKPTLAAGASTSTTR